MKEREGREEENVPSIFYKAGMILIPKLDKNSTRKQNTISLKSMLAEIINEILAIYSKEEKTLVSILIDTGKESFKIITNH